MTNSSPRQVVEYAWYTSSPSRTNVLNPGLSVRYPTMSVPDARALCSTIGGNASPDDARAGRRICATASRDSSSVCEKPRSKLKSPSDDEAHGRLQPMRRLYAWSFSIGACDTNVTVTSRARRCGSTPSTESAIDELTGPPANSSIAD